MQRARLPESACCMSCHLPSSFVSLRSLAGHAPAVLCVLLLALLSASLASQTRSLRRELAELPAAAAPAPPANPSAAPRAALAGLFGGAPSPRGATAGERLQLRLLACFLARREDRSAALIAVAGRSQRFLPGAEVRPGTVLLAVHRDHVVLRDQGYEERLYFPKAEGAETTHATL
ncbi:TPA: pilus assembly protein PilZ [Pseudomonas aeruginosa]|nr:pilus assembly protein PilZ [Pseudomonas aeruginosa]